VTCKVDSFFLIEFFLYARAENQTPNHLQELHLSWDWNMRAKWGCSFVSTRCYNCY